LDGAEVPRGAEAQGQPHVLVRLLGGREEDARVLGQAADVEVGQLVGRHDLLVEFVGRSHNTNIHKLWLYHVISMMYTKWDDIQIYPYT